MSRAPDRLTSLVEPIVSGLGYELLGMEFVARPRSSLLRVYIDREDGIALQDCSRVSHQLSGMLDVEDPIAGNYHLEVSSPGMDRLLFKLADFERFKGSTVRVHLSEVMNGRKKIKGELLGVKRDVVRVEENGHVLEIPHRMVKKARLVPEFKASKNGS